jgi:hypothetical protein
VSSPGDGARITKEKAVSSNRSANVRTTGITHIQKSPEVGKVFATELQLEFTSALEIVEDMFAGIPVSVVIEG